MEYVLQFAVNYSTTYVVSIRGNNKKTGKDSTFSFDTDPPELIFKWRPYFKEKINSTIYLNIPPLDDERYHYPNITNISLIVAVKMDEFTHNATNYFRKKFGNQTFFVNNFTIIDDILLDDTTEEKVFPYKLTNDSENLSINISLFFINQYRQKISYKRYDLYKEFETNWENTIKTNIPPKNIFGGKDESINNSLYALFILLLLVIPFILYLYWRNKLQKAQVSSDQQSTDSSNDLIGLDNLPRISIRSESSIKNRVKVKEKISKPKKELPKISNQTNISTSKTYIKISDFKNYVKEGLANNELQEQHKSFPRGQTKPWDYGIKKENKSKNRYGNLIAFDHNRVKLKKLRDDLHSDYINASYIDGYQTKRTYIATQGPKENTLDDFWRMIWQEHSIYIVMLCNVVENGKKKCEQYWPGLNESRLFGDIEVVHVNTKIYADYACRSFKVTCGKESRLIIQYHFVSWPDHGVPLYAKSLVPFLKHVLAIPLKHPIVIHCSAGVGRTGVILLCDICLRMAAQERAVDIVKYQSQLREQRPNMVDNFDQYRLVHLVLIECLLIKPTGLICDSNLESQIKKLLSKNSIKEQMSVIDEHFWMDRVMKSEVQSHKNNEMKNRFPNIVPEDTGCVYISRFPINDAHADYINAVYVDGFRQKKQFIVTQQPLPNTFTDFWRMIAEKEVGIVVSLNHLDFNDKTICPIYPEDGSSINPVPYLTVKHISTTDLDFYKFINLNLSGKSTENGNDIKQTVYIIQIENWLPNVKTPPGEINSLIQLWDNIEIIPKKDTPILVTCYDGATASGLFVAFAFMIEKIKLEQECDVCLAVRTIRHNRQQFVKHESQFEYLYRAAVIYVEIFQLYSNFQSGVKK